MPFNFMLHTLSKYKQSFSVTGISVIKISCKCFLKIEYKKLKRLKKLECIKYFKVKIKSINRKVLSDGLLALSKKINIYFWDPLKKCMKDISKGEEGR